MRCEHPFNYKGILEIAKNLKNLNHNVLKQTAKFFNESHDPNDDGIDEDDDSGSYLEDINGDTRNLVDKVIYNANNMANIGASFDKYNVKKRWWTQEEDDQLKQLVDEFGAKNWKRIASFFQDRTDVQCLHRWQKVLNPKLIKGPWVILTIN